MKKSAVVKKLDLRRITVAGMTKAAGAGAYVSYGAYCSHSCSSCGNADEFGYPCEVIAPSDGANVCSNYY